ncbi:unnamed protein product [Clavelina lepadiformis]|uniref:Transmembrane protein 243 n=1 Tax=Clavelina lepadiformis TaxID=159417 RepID=A0ABP0FBD6_CLALP
MIAYTVQDDMDRPLFGVSTRRERLLNLVVGLVTSLLVTATLISAFLFPDPHHINPLSIFFAVCIAFVCASLLTLIYWYRQGDVDPKFRKMIYYNSIVIVLLCVCANLYYHGDELGLNTCNQTSDRV